MKSSPTALLLVSLLTFTSPAIRAQGPLIWSDEFEYIGSPDPDLWDYDIGGHGWGNDERQYYTDRTKNSRVEGGRLIIEAHKENYEGNAYTSARLVTRNKADWLYGRVEIRAKLPYGRGTWPAIWMLPTDWLYGGWPESGEIDIMEHVGYDMGVVHASTHSLDFNWQTGGQQTATIELSDVDTAFHVYALEWRPNRIDAYLDGVKYFTAMRDDGWTWTAWPFDKPFHLLLNIAVGGTWGGARGVSPKIWPQRMEVDYVRVYGLDITDTEVPSMPGNLAGTPSSSSIYLSWFPSIDDYAVKDYSVFFEGDLLDSTIYHNYTVTGLDPLKEYSIAVRARDYVGNVSPLAVGWFTTTDLNPITIPATIEAEDYDAQSGVQTEETQDEGGGLNVGWIDAGDWMEYVVDVTDETEFVVDYRVAAASIEGEIVLEVDGWPVAVTIVPVTGDWQNWVTITSTAFPLADGTHRLRLYAEEGGFNVNWLDFREAPVIGGDFEPPSTPTDLTASSTATTVNLQWSASTDNVSVSGYNVYQEDLLIGTPPNPGYEVTGLAPRSGYFFEVSAFDAAGNESDKARVKVRTRPR